MSKKRFYSAFLVVMVSIATVVFFSCDPVANDDKPEYTLSQSYNSVLNGYWKSNYGDGFDLSGDVFTYYGDNTKTLAYRGTIELVYSNKTNENQYITFLVTEKDDSGWYSMGVGKYYTILMKDITQTTCKEAGAYKSGGKNDEETAEKASKEFTIENGYFTFFGDYVKQ